MAPKSTLVVPEISETMYDWSSQNSSTCKAEESVVLSIEYGASVR